MTLRFATILLLTATAAAQDTAIPGNGKGTCPPRLKSSSVQALERTIPSAPVAGVHYAGTVTMLISLSDTGYVCEVNILKSTDPMLNEEATTAIREQVFQPIQLDGKPIAGSMMIYRDFWRGDHSDFLMAENANATPDEIPFEMETSSTDIPRLVSAATIDGTRYRNDYFGITFTANGAELTTPPLAANRGSAIRLVQAVATDSEISNRYALLVSADPISKYPMIKLQSQYLGILSFASEREGAKKSRGDFPFMISGVQFMGAILKQTDGPNQRHFVGLFTTARKGYFLSLDITAATEQQVLKIASSVQIDHDH
jgi:hypothetical protein